MKYRIVGVLLMVLILVDTISATILDQSRPGQRIHQHKVARQPDAGCDRDCAGLCTHLPLVIYDMKYRVHVYICIYGAVYGASTPTLFDIVTCILRYRLLCGLTEK